MTWVLKVEEVVPPAPPAIPLEYLIAGGVALALIGAIGIYELTKR